MGPENVIFCPSTVVSRLVVSVDEIICGSWLGAVMGTVPISDIPPLPDGILEDSAGVLALEGDVLLPVAKHIETVRGETLHILSIDLRVDSTSEIDCTICTPVLTTSEFV